MEITKGRIYFILLIIVSAIFISPTFKFALSGDDWLTLFRFKISFNSISDYFNFSNFKSNYDFGNILMGTIYTLFGSGSFVYFLTSFLIKILLSITVYYFLNYIDGDRLKNSLISSSILLLNAGSESVNWVFNMHAYLAVILFFLIIYSFFKYESRTKFFYIPILILGCFIISPTRMHGLLFSIPLLVWTYKKGFRDFLISVTTFLMPIIIFRIVLQSSNDNYYQLLNKEFHIYIQFTESILKSLFNSIISIQFQSQLSVVKLIFILITYFIIYKSNIKSIFKLFSVFALLFLIIPQLINYQSEFLSVHRYLFLPGILLWISITNVLFKKLTNKVIKYCIFVLLLLINGITSYSYFNNLYLNGRSAEVTDKLFNQLIYFTNNNFVDENTLFLFSSNNSFKQYNSLEFGLTPKLLFLENRYNNDTTKAPNIVESKSSLTKLLNNDANEIYRYGFEKKNISLQNIYYLNISESNDLIDMTEEFRNSFNNNYNVNK